MARTKFSKYFTTDLLKVSPKFPDSGTFHRRDI